MRVFIGYDSRETIAWHVCAHSLMRRTREVLEITPISNNLPASIWWRGKGPHDSTEFSNARFMVPYLSNYEGIAVFCDCDMLWQTDICDLVAEFDHSKAVMVRKHQYVPAHSTKFLNQPQTRYARKNWSSLMMFNCAHPACRTLSPEYVNNAAGLDLHGFAWCLDEQIGSLSDGWNVLVKHEDEAHAVA